MASLSQQDHSHGPRGSDTSTASCAAFRDWGGETPPGDGEFLALPSFGQGALVVLLNVHHLLGELVFQNIGMDQLNNQGI